MAILHWRVSIEGEDKVRVQYVAIGVDNLIHNNIEDYPQASLLLQKQQRNTQSLTKTQRWKHKLVLIRTIASAWTHPQLFL